MKRQESQINNETYLSSISAESLSHKKRKGDSPSEIGYSSIIQNNEKNRYSSIVPNESTRVHLQLIEGEHNSDYINANFITVDTTQRYIACQAPLESTIEDFWRMIFEQNCGVIVMVTKCVEGNVTKASSYWPAEGQICQYGKLLVCHKRSFQLDGGITHCVNSLT